MVVPYSVSVKYIKQTIKENKDIQVKKKFRKISLISSIMFRKFKPRQKIYIKKKRVYLKEPTAKPMKTYLKEIVKIHFVVF